MFTYTVSNTLSAPFFTGQMSLTIVEGQTIVDYMEDASKSASNSKAFSK